MKIRIRVVEGATTPQYQTSGAAGMDLQAFIRESLDIDPGQRVRVPTGISVAIPEGYEAQIRPRSGVSYKKGLTVINTPGTIDSDYRGEVCVTLVNLSTKTQTVSLGDRIAQMVICPIVRAEWEVVTELDTTARGEGGYGSTGE